MPTHLLSATLLLLLAFVSCVPAHAQRVQISQRLGEWDDDSGFAPIHIIAAEQLGNFSTVIEASQEPLPLSGPLGGWQFIAGYSCYPETQWVIASFPNRNYEWLPQYGWFRSVQKFCFDVGPAAAVPGVAWPMPGMTPDYLDPKPKLSPALSEYRGTNSQGVVMKVGPEILPLCTNGVRRFLGTPAQ